MAATRANLEIYHREKASLALRIAGMKHELLTKKGHEATTDDERAFREYILECLSNLLKAQH